MALLKYLWEKHNQPEMTQDVEAAIEAETKDLHLLEEDIKEENDEAESDINQLQSQLVVGGSKKGKKIYVVVIFHLLKIKHFKEI